MSFRFFRPWEDAGQSNTRQTPHPSLRASSEASTTTLNPQPTTPTLMLTVQAEQRSVTSDEAIRSAEVVSDVPENLHQEEDAHRTERRHVWNASQLVALSMEDPQVCQVTALRQTSASDSGKDATNKDNDLYCTDKDASDSWHNCKLVWKSSSQKPETHKTCSSITSSHLAPTTALLNDFIEVMSVDMTLIFGKNSYLPNSFTHSGSLVSENNFNTEDALSMNADFTMGMSEINCRKTVEHSSIMKQGGQNPSPSHKEECCSETFPGACKAGKQKHLQQTESKPFQCETCGKSFSRSSSKHQHERTHTGSRPLECAVCKKTFSNPYSLKRHKRIHTGSKPFKCSVCHKAFRQSGHLLVHERMHTGSKPFKCSVCYKAFRQSSDLQVHEHIHTGSKPFKCYVCHKAFRQSGHLHIHERIHTGSKPFKCFICDKAFRESGSLHVHERIHTGSKPFKCSVCQRAFRRSSDLHVHERIHTGSMPFKCSICVKAFKRSGDLHIHERIHSGSKPFKCSVCEKAFNKSGNLHVHERIHTGSKPFI